MAASRGVNVGPCLFVCKGDLVRSKTNDFTVLLVYLPLPPDQLAGQHAVDEREPRGSPQLGARKICERMKEQIVDCLKGWILNATR